jgi:hypothetical protein
MSDPLDYVARVARRARMEEAPTGSVREAVLSRLMEENTPSPRPVWAFALTSLAVSVASLALLIGTVSAGQGGDPLVAFFDTGLTLTSWGWS